MVWKKLDGDSWDGDGGALVGILVGTEVVDGEKV